ncbi:hypothetical protein GJ698_20050 [Pseudoduganella sp. FT26W]|uniref:Uncharacterized protein n=1 Tax=Duganella aquatilis TaxID=2666082 RepID=A0A844DE01_9BURK|nr:hypothetical protein [Duganella aquatilis]MRW86370.1 hypothetical protein [Duganella aquatilis]
MEVVSASDEAPRDFARLSALLSPVAPSGLEHARQRLAATDREKLIGGFKKAFATDRRLLTRLIGEELVLRGVPPCYWHDTLNWKNASLSQRYDLFVGDLLWLRRWHRLHVQQIRYARYRRLLTGFDTLFYREVDHAFWAGRRPAWQLIKSLSLTVSQQWECAWLRSTPVQRKSASIDADSAGVLELLRADLGVVRRTAAYGEAEAEATLRRRHAIWRCWRIAGTASPTAIAARYEQLTGEAISRQLVANHLVKIRSSLKQKEMKTT